EQRDLEREVENRNQFALHLLEQQQQQQAELHQYLEEEEPVPALVDTPGQPGGGGGDGGDGGVTADTVR
ncbi:hypothetical protein LOAG_19121, partial [Loa loa]